MPLQVWLPFLGNADNQGLSDITVVNNGATVDNSGKLGKCYSFGTSTSYLTLSNDAVNKCTTECSLGFWLNITSWNTSYATYFQAGLGGAPWAHYIFGVLRNNAASNLCFTISNGSSASNASYTTSNLDLNTWYHLTFVYKTGHCLIYINGELYKDYATTIVPNFSGITKTTVGVCNNGSYQTNCKLNDLRIYDHALSPKEVKLLSQGLVAHYQLNGDGRGCDNILTNSSGYNGISGWGGLVSIGNENGTPYLISKRTDTTTTSRTFVTHSAITSLVSSWSTGDKFTISGYYRVPSNETYAVQANMFIRWGASTSTSDTGFYTPSASVVVKDTWIRFEYTFEVPSYTSGSAVNFYLSAFSQGLSTVHWKYLKLEKGDKATPWLPNSSDAQYSAMGYNDTTVYDSSGYNYHGKINTAQAISSNTARYSVSTNFDGVQNAIKIPFNTMLGITTAGKTDYTISVWTYKTGAGSKAHQTIIGGPGGFEIEARNGTGTDPLYRIYNWGGATTSYEYGKWQHCCFVHTSADSKLYVNSELRLTGSSANVPIGDYFIGSWRDVSSQNYQGNMSDFRIYATALSADDIKALYNTPVSIANNGAMLTQGEFVEV